MGGAEKFWLVKFLLLLLVVETCLNCKHFNQTSISDRYKTNIDTLQKSFPLDYLTETVTNLREDSLCSDVWNMYFIQKEFERIHKVSGGYLRMNVSEVLKDLKFTKSCIFSISKDCVIERKTNISVLLNIALSTGLRMKFPANLTNCSNILCDKVATITRAYPTNSYGVPLHSDIPDKDNQESDTSQEETTKQDRSFLWKVCIIAISIGSISTIILLIRFCPQRNEMPH